MIEFNSEKFKNNSRHIPLSRGRRVENSQKIVAVLLCALIILIIITALTPIAKG